MPPVQLAPWAFIPEPVSGIAGGRWRWQRPPSPSSISGMTPPLDDLALLAH